MSFYVAHVTQDALTKKMVLIFFGMLATVYDKIKFIIKQLCQKEPKLIKLTKQRQVEEGSFCPPVQKWC